MIYLRNNFGNKIVFDRYSEKALKLQRECTKKKAICSRCYFQTVDLAHEGISFIAN